LYTHGGKDYLLTAVRDLVRDLKKNGELPDLQRRGLRLAGASTGSRGSSQRNQRPQNAVLWPPRGVNMLR
jgi:hypothetical protein